MISRQTITLALLGILFCIIITSCTFPPSNSLQEDSLTGDASLQTYKCVSKDTEYQCESISGTRCYYYDINQVKRYRYCPEGWVSASPPIVDEVTPGLSGHSYFCYPDKDYCRLDGLVTNPKVLKTEVG